ncbi:MAG: hypothetical protein A3I62_00450 [Betaproteobacteria bacterium RIFCSPLOWO2_02_FULL_62_79]|nr:MAG: hypothetical protein A3I62_00450 [Betaproteobacteria bacterium RIFCSPLOWO2_02_FULL_62_79]
MAAAPNSCLPREGARAQRVEDPTGARATQTRDVFQDRLARMPNNGRALYGQAQANARQGLKREARTVDERLVRAWVDERKRLDLARL